MCIFEAPAVVPVLGLEEHVRIELLACQKEEGILWSTLWVIATCKVLASKSGITASNFAVKIIYNSVQNVECRPELNIRLPRKPRQQFHGLGAFHGWMNSGTGQMGWQEKLSMWWL